MSEMNVRPLYLADNFSKLNLVSIPCVKKSDPREVIDRARFSLRAAEIREDLDEEMAYVCYKEFLNCYKQALNRSNDGERKYLNGLITPDRALKALEKWEKLAKKLCNRYETRRMAVRMDLNGTSIRNGNWDFWPGLC